MTGTIVTFYSYKGGVGRTLALANVAALLARWGHRVLCVDWDLEAPGLHLYFKKYQDTDFGRGVVDLLIERTKGKRKAKLSRFITRTRLTSEARGEGRLDVMPAGLFDGGYTKRLQSLDWNALYRDKGLGEILEELRRELTAAYDFVLMDSRTGVTDVGSICAVQLPDILVAMTTASEQSLEGVADVSRRIAERRRAMPIDRPILHVLPVISRFDQRVENKIASEWLERFKKILAPLYATWLGAGTKPEEMLALTKIPYVPFWSFGEKLPVLEEGTADPETIGYALETIAALVARRLADNGMLVRGRDAYLTTARSARARSEAARGVFAHDAFICAGPQDRGFAEKLAAALHERGIHVYCNDSAPDEATRARGASRNMVLVVGAGFGAEQTETAMSFLTTLDPGRQRVVPILVENAGLEHVPAAFRSFRAIEAAHHTFDALVVRTASMLSSPPRADDPEHGRWGGASTRRGRTLEASIERAHGDFVRIELKVRAKKRAPPLAGTVTFSANPTGRLVDAKVRDGVAEYSFYAAVPFTVGALADGGGTVLELDLAEVPGAPPASPARPRDGAR